MGSFLLILVLVGLFIFFWRRYKLEQELAAMSWKIRWEELDGEESQKKNEKKKAKKRKNHNDYLPESDPLLRSTSRSSVNSDKVRVFVLCALFSFLSENEIIQSRYTKI